MKDIDPWFGNCTDLFFTGYDPPRALKPATALVPSPTTQDPNTSQRSSIPNPSHNWDPKESGGGQDPPPVPVPEPASSPSPPQPQKTPAPITGSEQSGSHGDPGSKSNEEGDPSSGSNGDPGGNLDQGSSPGSVPSSNSGSNVANPKHQGPPGPASSSQQHGSNSDPPNGVPSNPENHSNPDMDNQHGNGGLNSDLGVDPGGSHSPGQGGNLGEGSGEPAQSSPTTITAAIGDQGPGESTVINGMTIKPVTDGISIAGHLIPPGAPPMTISGIQISLNPSKLIVGTSTIPIEGQFLLSVIRPPITVDGQIITPYANGISVAGTYLSPGDPAITIASTPISLGESEIVVGTSTLPHNLLRPGLVQEQTSYVNGLPIQKIPGEGAISVAGQMIRPGLPPVTISGYAVSLGSSTVFVDSKPIPIASIAAPPIVEKPTTIDGNAVQLLPNANEVSIAGTTLTPGAPAMTVSSTPISLGLSALIIGTSSIPIASISALQNAEQDTIIDGQTIQFLPGASAISIDGTTLTSGGPGITVSGTPISLGLSGLVIGSSTIPLETLITSVNGQLVTANPTAVEVAGSTLTPGASGVMIDGTLVSLDSAGKLILGSTTVPLEATGSNIGGLIMGGFGDGGPFATSSATNGSVANNTSGNVLAFQGEGTALRELKLVARIFAVMMLIVALASVV